MIDPSRKELLNLKVSEMVLDVAKYGYLENSRIQSYSIIFDSKKELDDTLEYAAKAIGKKYAKLPLIIELPEHLSRTALWDAMLKELIPELDVNSLHANKEYEKKINALMIASEEKVPLIIVKGIEQYKAVRNLYILLNQIKNITNIKDIPVIVFGTEKLPKLISNDEQFYSRFQCIKFVLVENNL